MVWWICKQYIPDKKLYAVGGYLTCKESDPKCFLYDFKEAASDCEAEIMVMEESMQFVLEDGQNSLKTY